MERIVINLEPSFRYLSDEALRLLAERSGMEYNDHLRFLSTFESWHPFFHYGEIVNIVEELGERANGAKACLVIIDVPDHYRGVIEKSLRGGEMVRFQWKEDYLRELIRLGKDEDTIVKYVQGKLY